MTCNAIAGGNDYWCYGDSPYTGMLPYNQNVGTTSTETSDSSTMTGKFMDAAKDNATALKESFIDLVNTPKESLEEWKNDPLKACLKSAVFPGGGNFLINSFANASKLLWTYHGSYLWNNPVFAAFA